MAKILITGVSSGIGRALTKRLVEDGNFVWGIARRKQLLISLKKEMGPRSNFFYSRLDVANTLDWQKLISKMKIREFVPDVVIFNAAIMENDLSPLPKPEITKMIFDVNFFSIINGVEALLKSVKPGAQFIAISSLSALKGSSIEGIGYPASKAALSIAFESLHRKFGYKYNFKTIYFGPVATGMGPFKETLPIILSERQAVDTIIKAIKSKQIIYYSPRVIFLALRVMKMFPSSLYFKALSKIEKLHLGLAKRQKL